MKKRPFDQVWTLQDTQHYVEAIWNKKLNGGSGGSEQMDAAFKNLHRAQVQHLGHLFEEGLMRLPSNTEALDVRWLRAWKKLQAGSPMEIWDEEDAVRPLNSLRYVLFSIQVGASEETIQSVHDSVVAAMMSGDFDDEASEKCQNTGVKVGLQLTGWQPVLGERVFESENSFKSSFVPLDFSHLKAPGIEEVILNVPSGQLWCADWFRVEELTALDKALEKASSLDLDLDSSRGTLNKSLEFHKNFGGMHIFVGNSSPSFVQENNIAMIANIDEDETPFHRASGLQQSSRITTDLWWVTMVDPQVLEEKLQEHWKNEPEKVRNVMEKLHTQVGKEIVKVDVKPGNYHVYFAAHHNILESEWDKEEWKMVPHAQTYMVLSDLPLTPQAKPSPMVATSARSRMR